MVEFLDLAGAGLSEWENPAGAAAASVDSQMKVMAMLLATRMLLQRKHYAAVNRLEEKKLERELDDLRHTGYMLASLLNAERHQ